MFVTLLSEKNNWIKDNTVTIKTGNIMFYWFTYAGKKVVIQFLKNNFSLKNITFPFTNIHYKRHLTEVRKYHCHIDADKTLNTDPYIESHQHIELSSVTLRKPTWKRCEHLPEQGVHNNAHCHYDILSNVFNSINILW